MALSLSSTAFEHEGQIPTRQSCEGEDLSPPLSWSDLPDGTRSLALICDDPDAPSGTFVHWLAWGIDPGRDGLGEGEAVPAEGTGGFGETGYRGPARRPATAPTATSSGSTPSTPSSTFPPGRAPTSWRAQSRATCSRAPS
jgi:phosphatidylethanolamine-binding protein (PEBP) family uncharacterized protein